MSSVKEKLLEALKASALVSIQTANAAIKSAEDSKLSETKSSAGDKFETGRAMMQLEQEKSEVQLANAKQLLNMLKQLDISQKSKTITHGSLVTTDRLVYFISAGLGKIVLEDQSYYAISPVSPIGQLLIGKSVGDQISFRGQNILIKDFS